MPAARPRIGLRGRDPQGSGAIRASPAAFGPSRTRALLHAPSRTPQTSSVTLASQPSPHLATRSPWAVAALTSAARR